MMIDQKTVRVQGLFSAQYRWSLPMPECGCPRKIRAEQLTLNLIPWRAPERIKLHRLADRST